MPSSTQSSLPSTPNKSVKTESSLLSAIDDALDATPSLSSTTTSPTRYRGDVTPSERSGDDAGLDFDSHHGTPSKSKRGSTGGGSKGTRIKPEPANSEASYHDQGDDDDEYVDEKPTPKKSKHSGTSSTTSSPSKRSGGGGGGAQPNPWTAEEDVAWIKVMFELRPMPWDEIKAALRKTGAPERTNSGITQHWKVLKKRVLDGVDASASARLN